MPKHLLLTGYDDHMTYIGHLTSPLMLAYALQHGMDFECIRNYEKDSHPSWQKIPHILRALSSGYTSVLWLDADTVITNFARAPWKKCTSGIHVSKDWGSDADETGLFSLGNFAAYQDTIPIWEEVLKRSTKWANERHGGQSCLYELCAESTRIKEQISLLPRRSYNSVPSEIATSSVMAKEPWRRGDWLCHLTCLSPERRIALFSELSPREYAVDAI